MALTDTGGGLLQYPVKREDYHGNIRFTPEHGDADQIELYLPSSIQLHDGVTIDNYNRNPFIGSAVDNIMRGSSGNPHTDDGFFDRLMNSLSDATEDMGFAKGLFGDAALLTIARMNAGIGNYIRDESRKSPNPNMRALFKQVNLRNFSFTFKMIPTSEDEARTIGSIIKSFRRNMYPEHIGTGDTPFGYEFPSQYKVEIFYDDMDMTHAYNIKTDYCFINSLVTNYNASGMSFMKGRDGKPYFSEIDLTLSLMEGRTLHKDAVKRGY